MTLCQCLCSLTTNRSLSVSLQLVYQILNGTTMKDRSKGSLFCGSICCVDRTEGDGGNEVCLVFGKGCVKGRKEGSDLKSLFYVVRGRVKKKNSSLFNSARLLCSSNHRPFFLTPPQCSAVAITGNSFSCPHCMRSQYKIIPYFIMPV